MGTDDLLSSVRQKYSTIKTMDIYPATTENEAGVSAGSDLVVKLQFSGPQPSEGPGSLLCNLLCGTSVKARPVELPRGRKKREMASPTASSEGRRSGGATRERTGWCSHLASLSVRL